MTTHSFLAATDFQQRSAWFVLSRRSSVASARLPGNPLEMEHGPAPATAIYILLLHTSDRADNHSRTDALLVGRILMRQRLVKEGPTAH